MARIELVNICKRFKNDDKPISLLFDTMRNIQSGMTDNGRKGAFSIENLNFNI